MIVKFLQDSYKINHKFTVSHSLLKGVIKINDDCKFIFFSLDLNSLEQIRAQIPVQTQKRLDLYKLQMVS